MLKHENICLPGNNSTLQSTSAHETSKFSNSFTWAKVHALALELRGKLPKDLQDAVEVESVQDLKITLCLMVAFGALLLPFAVSFPIIATLAYSSYSWKMKNEKGGRG